MGKDLQELENKLWAAANKMRSGISVSNYKFVILGLIFLKYISESFEERYNELLLEGHGFEKYRDAYIQDNIFFVPEKSRWSYISSKSKEPNIGEIVDNALDLIERENPTLKGVLFKIYKSWYKRSKR